jgi:hypothetical protein
MNEDVGSPVMSALAGAMEKSRPGQPVWTSETMRTVRVLCVPIGDILEILGWKKVGFWSLDIEGSDLDVLQGFPWKTVDVEVPIKHKI